MGDRQPGIPDTPADLWFRRLHPARVGAPPLICFPHAGGAANAYHRLAGRLSPAVDVLGVQYPGRQDRRGEPPIVSIIDLATTIAEQWALLQQVEGWSEPPALFGHSMGAFVAFEVARLLDGDGNRGARALFVSGRRAPTWPSHEPRYQDSETGALEMLRDLGGTDAQILADRQVMASALPTIVNDFRVVGAYPCPHRKTVRCRVVALVGDADPVAPVDTVRDWRSHAAGAFDLEVLPGGHFYLQEQFVSVAEIISQTLLDGDPIGGRL